MSPSLRSVLRAALAGAIAAATASPARAADKEKICYRNAQALFKL